MRPLILSGMLSVALCCGCCEQPPEGRAANDHGGTEAATGKLDGLTAETISGRARQEGFKVREEATERAELPGATIHRLTLDHESRGSAFVDLYDFSELPAHPEGPAAKVGPTKTLYARLEGSTTTSAALIASLIETSPLGLLTRSGIEDQLRSGGWTLGNSSRFQDDIRGQQITDVTAEKDGASLMLVLMDYTRVAEGKEPSVMLRDGTRLLFVDMEKHRWAASLLEEIVE